MKYGLQGYTGGRQQKGLDIGKTVELLRRYMYLEHAFVRAIAGWFLILPAWETKIKLGYQLYAHAERMAPRAWSRAIQGQHGFIRAIAEHAVAASFLLFDAWTGNLLHAA